MSDPAEENLHNPPEDGVSSLAWAHGGPLLACGSWDSTARVWALSGSRGHGQVSPSVREFGGPVLDVAFNDRDSGVFVASADTTVRLWDLASDSAVLVGQHDAPVKSVHFVPAMGLLVSGSWDQTVRFWDARASAPVAVVEMPDRVYDLDAVYPLMVVACGDRQSAYFDLSASTKPVHVRQGPLRHQSRCVAVFSPADGYALGSIEGRVCIEYVDLAQPAQANSKSFAFKCHRRNNEIKPVNDIAFHREYNTFATVGADGTYNFWDKAAKQRLRAGRGQDTSISAGQFSASGRFFAYAVCYDWHLGANSSGGAPAPKVVLRAVPDEEIRPRVSRS